MFNRLDRRLLETIDREAARHALLASDGAIGWEGVRNLTRPELDALTAQRETKESLVPDDPDQPFTRMRKALELDPLAADIVLVLLAPFVEPRYRDVYGLIQDDTAQHFATERLLRSVLGGTFAENQSVSSMLAETGPLLLSGFIRSPSQGSPAPLQRAFTLPEDVAHCLLGPPSAPRTAVPERPQSAPFFDRARVFTGFGLDVHAVLQCMPAGAKVIPGALERGLSAEDARVAAAARWRTGLMADLWPLIDLRACTTEAAIAAAEEIARLTDSYGGRGWLMAAAPLPVAVPQSRLQPPAWSERVTNWKKTAEAANLTLSRDTIERIASRHRVSREDMQKAIADVHARAPDDPGLALATVLADQSFVLPRHARQITPKVRFDDLVLRRPTRAALARLCHLIAHRDRIAETQTRQHFQLDRGPLALFFGRPGTGKTIAAEALASELGRPLFIADLSQLLNKYVGETEKHIDEALTEAERAGAVMLFDEADTLFTRRVEQASSGGEQFSNMVVGYLLQRIEQHDGPVVLATNLTQAMDEAMLRRFRVRVEFPLPDETERGALWLRMLGPETAKTVDCAPLAKVHRLSGGEIRNAALKATLIASERGVPIDIQVLEEAVGIELYEMGHLSTHADHGGADDPAARGTLLSNTSQTLQRDLEDHLKSLYLKEVFVISGAPTERNLSGLRPALSLAMFSLAGQRGTDRLRLRFLISAWSTKSEEELELLGLAHAYFAAPRTLSVDGLNVQIRLQESHDFELLYRFWSSHNQPLKPSVVLETEIV